MSLAIKAFLLAVLTAAAVGTVGLFTLGLVEDWIDDGPSYSITGFDLRLWLLAFGYLAVFSALSLGIFGTALTVLLSRFSIERAWTYPAVGTLIGLAVAFAFWTPIGEPYRVETLLFQVTAGAIPGAVAGVVWWRLYRSRARWTDEADAR